ncbi:phosphoribosylglycinamide formyltransferase [Planctobacterium marinum]|uniref:Phosphoribosylglycinamide formyltransferase n=1 Tax=Planctobacterium marinum TaxID=1631968 RepID=A0AA48HL01_9ALTE|nr:phosphoribosylglycinamide formyltransferase [Planctobacterium marinum]
MKKRIVVLISGSGSNLQAIIDAVENGQINGQVVAVISNKSDAFGLKRAENHNIEHCVINHKNYPDRESFDAQLQTSIEQFAPDIVVLAGFMRILTPGFVTHFTGKLINIHPSLLPKFKGLDTHQRALDAEEQYHGASVHFVTPELDGGPVIVQAPVAIVSGETVDSLKAKVHKVEHQIYPLAVQLLCEDKITMTNEGVHYMNEMLPQSGIIHEVKI